VELREAYEKELREKTPKCSEKSQRIVKELMKKSLKNVFEMLDSDKNGLVDYENQNMRQLPKHVQEALSDWFEKMKDLKSQQNFEQFYQSAIKILKVFILILNLEFLELN